MTAAVALVVFAMGAAEWFGGPYGGGPGRISFEQDGTNAYARLEKDRGPGATQIISRNPAAIGAARRFEVSFSHRGADGAFRWRLERRNVKGRYEPVKNSAGHDFAEYVPFKGATNWTRHVQTVSVPARLVDGANAVSVKFDVWGGNGRVFVSADAMAFQPFRINEADNAALLENVMGWLLGKPVTQGMRDAFKANLFLTEKTFQQVRK